MKKWIYRIALLICAAVFVYSASNLVIIYQKEQEVEKEVQQLAQNVVEIEDESGPKGYEVNWKKLQKTNPDIIAWLYVPDCDISFPIVQTTDNSYYLYHSFNGEDNYLGAIFMACENMSDFSDGNSIIYGHSVDGTGGMFTDLKNFKDETFFNEHPYLYLFTPNGNYVGNIFTFAQAEDGTDYYTISFGGQKDAYMQSFKDLSLYSNDISTDGNLITLSTCNLDYGFHSSQRYILSAVLEKTEEPIFLK